MIQKGDLPPSTILVMKERTVNVSCLYNVITDHIDTLSWMENNTAELAKSEFFKYSPPPSNCFL